MSGRSRLRWFGQRSRLLLAIAALIATAGLTADSVSAWTPISSSRPTWSGPVHYSLNAAGSEDLGGFTATESVVRQAIEDWTRVSCTSLETVYDGQTNARPRDSGSTGVVGWYETSWSAGSGVIGQTSSSFGSRGIARSNISMNGVHFTWTTGSGSGSRVNAYSIVLHESGHFFGLGHSSDRGAAMYASYSGGVLSITGDDEEGICTLYPGDGGQANDCTTAGCPSGESCVNGACVPDMPAPSPALDICEPCSSDAECGDSSDRCIRYPDGDSYCGRECSSDTDCDGDVCNQVSNGRFQCVRRDSNGDATCDVPPGMAPDPDPTPDPDPDPDPVPDPDPTPDPDPEPDPDPAPDPAPEPEPMDPSTGGEPDPTVPDPTEPGDDEPMTPREPGTLGDPCATNEDCASGVCAEDPATGAASCTELCTGDQCPSGFTCDDTGVVAVCRSSGRGGLGTACEMPLDCLSGSCARDADGNRFCTRKCSTDSECPMGYSCFRVEDSPTGACGPATLAAEAPSSLVLTGNGCSVAAPGSGTTSWSNLVWLLSFVALLRRRRRRRT